MEAIGINEMREAAAGFACGGVIIGALLFVPLVRKIALTAGAISVLVAIYRGQGIGVLMDVATQVERLAEHHAAFAIGGASAFAIVSMLGWSLRHAMAPQSAGSPAK